MKIAIIGAGAAGLMAAISASENRHNIVYLFEKNEKIGKKLYITGKGRCNLTNACDIFEFRRNIVTNDKFLYNALSKFDNKSIMQFFNENGLKTKIERGNRVFPFNDKSYSVISCFKKLIESKKNICLCLNTTVIDIFLNNDNTFDIKYIVDNNTINDCFDKIIICTGGLSYKSTGSTGDGYKFAKKFNLGLEPCFPSLVPLKVKQENEIKYINGLTLRNVVIRVLYNSKIIYKDFGEMMFRDNCLDGPIVLSASSYITDKINNNLVLSIDFKPSLDFEKLDNRLLRDINEFKNESISFLLKRLLPNDFVHSFFYRLVYELGYNDINIKKFADKQLSNLTKNERRKVLNLLKDYKFDIVDTAGFDRAIITKGGISVKEINNKTFESKKVKNLYFAGEILDIDALTGGFNLSIAFITGYLAGKTL